MCVSEKCKSACGCGRGPHTHPQGLVMRALWVLFLFCLLVFPSEGIEKMQGYHHRHLRGCRLELLRLLGLPGQCSLRFTWIIMVLWVWSSPNQWWRVHLLPLIIWIGNRMLTYGVQWVGGFPTDWMKPHPMARICEHGEWWENPPPFCLKLFGIITWYPMRYLLFIVLSGLIIEWWPHHALQGQRLIKWRKLTVNFNNSFGSKFVWGPCMVVISIWHTPSINVGKMLGVTWVYVGFMLGLTWV